MRKLRARRAAEPPYDDLTDAEAIRMVILRLFSRLLVAGGTRAGRGFAQRLLNLADAAPDDPWVSFGSADDDGSPMRRFGTD